MSKWTFEGYARNPDSGRGFIKEMNGNSGRVIAYDVAREDAERIIQAMRKVAEYEKAAPPIVRDKVNAAAETIMDFENKINA